MGSPAGCTSPFQFFLMIHMNTSMNRLATGAAAPTWMLTLGLLAALAATLVVATPAWSQDAAPKTTGAITVNGEAQPARHAELLLNDQLARGASDTPALRAQVRETVINQALMAQAASKAKLDGQPDVRARLALARQSALAQAWQQQVLRGVRITEADLVAEYQRQVQALGSEEVRLRHVLVADEPQARQVLAQLAGGAAFEALAAELSRDNSTRERGGLSDWVPVGSLAPGVAQALKGLAPGQLAPEPIQTPSGWQVLKLEGLRPFSPPPMAMVQGPLRRTLEQRALQAALQVMRDSARVE